MSTDASNDEKLIAAINYWGSLILWCSGIFWFLPPLIILLIKKDESALIRKHAIQSLAFNIALFGFGVAIWIASALAGVILIATLGLGFILYLVFIPITIIASIGAAVYLALLGFWTYQGKDPNIPVITPFLQKRFGV